jgi:DHA1 family tetracycline resistance protein-like MFS transporter
MSRRSPLLPIFLIVLVDIFGFTLVIPLLPIYAERMGATAFQATLVFSIFAVCQLISGPILGQVSDRIGRKPMLLVSQVGTFLGLLVLARAEALWMIYLGRIIAGLTAGNLSIAQAYISDNTEAHDRAKSFAIIGIAFGVGFFLGPFVTGYLVRYGLATPIYAAAGLSVLSVVCTALLLPGGRPPHAHEGEEPVGPAGRRLGLLSWSSYAQYFARPVLGAMLVQFFCFAFSFSTFIAGFALFAERTFQWKGRPFGPREVGYLFAYVGFLGIILQGGLIGRLVRRFGEGALVMTGFGSLVVGYLALGLIHALGPLVLVSTISSFGNGVLRPALTSLVTQSAARREQGLVLGLTQSVNSLAQVLAPSLAGLLIGRGMLSPWAWVAASAALLGLAGTRFGSALAPRVVLVRDDAAA